MDGARSTTPAGSDMALLMLAEGRTMNTNGSWPVLMPVVIVGNGLALFDTTVTGKLDIRGDSKGHIELFTPCLLGISLWA